MKARTNEEPSQPRLAAWIAGWTGFVLVLALAVVIALLAWRWVSAPSRGKLQAREQINSGSFRIAAYDHFFNLCVAAQTDDVRLDAQYQELAGATGDDRARIRANLAGLESDRAEAINEYNADARKGYTLGQFRSSALPYQLPTIPHVKGATIACTA